MNTETLYTCPVCHKPNFSKPGLKAHRCDGDGQTDFTGKRVKRWLMPHELAEAFSHPQIQGVLDFGIPANPS